MNQYNNVQLSNEYNVAIDRREIVFCKRISIIDNVNNKTINSPWYTAT